MRKRKSPIVLVTLLVVVVAGVAGFNFASSRVASPDAPPQAPPVENTQQVGEARSATPAASITQTVKQSLNADPKAGGPGPGGRPGGPGGPGGPPSGPLILNPAAGKPEKPKPNTSATSAQWYNDESMMGKKG